MVGNIRILEAIDKQVLREREQWNDLLEGVWPNISLYMGRAFSIPIYSFRNFNNSTFEGFGTHVLAIKQPVGAMKFYHPLGCLFTKGKTLFYERMLVKLVTFGEEQVHPRMKPHIRENDVFTYSLKEVGVEKVNNLLDSKEITQETAIRMNLLIENVRKEVY